MPKNRAATMPPTTARRHGPPSALTMLYTRPKIPAAARAGMRAKARLYEKFDATPASSLAVPIIQWPK